MELKSVSIMSESICEASDSNHLHRIRIDFAVGVGF